jgi:hypothetical protein
MILGGPGGLQQTDQKLIGRALEIRPRQRQIDDLGIGYRAWRPIGGASIPGTEREPGVLE